MPAGAEQVRLAPTAVAYCPAGQAEGKDDSLAQGIMPVFKVPVSDTDQIVVLAPLLIAKIELASSLFVSNLNWMPSLELI